MKLKARATMVLAEKKTAPKQTTGGILIPGQARIEGHTYDCGEALDGGKAMVCRVIDIGPPGFDENGLRVMTDVKVGDEIICKPHVGEKVQSGDPEIWAIDWSDILGVVESETVAA